jgi:hypothetical protein
MFKVSYSASTINSFGRMNFADSLIGNASVYKTIDQMPGNRDVKAQYTYSDLFRSYFLLTLCGGECAEDITRWETVTIGMKNYEVASVQKNIT